MNKPKTVGRLCVAIGEKTIDGALAAAGQAASMAADVIEIRLDCLETAVVAAFTAAIDTPLLFTNRPLWEGGNFVGEELQRVDLLLEAVAAGAAYVDLELRAPAQSLRRVLAAKQSSSTRLILSNHNFEMTPSRKELLDVLRSMKNQGADVGKIVTTAHTHQDVLRVLRLQEDAELLELPLIAFSMGQVGVMSRLATLGVGGYMTYCALAEQGETAPGQITIQAMRDILKLLSWE